MAEISKISVVLSDDQTIVRHALRSILEKSNRYNVVAEAGTVDDTVKLVGEHHPELLILDIGLPGKSGIEAIYELGHAAQPPKIAILSMYAEREKVIQALRGGASGYILKTCSPKEFTDALDTVMGGNTYIPPEFEDLRGQVGQKNGTASSGDPLQKLSKREREIFYLIANGMPNRIIAKKLYISPRTVETHRARVIKKLGFGSTADLIRYAIRNHLMTL